MNAKVTKWKHHTNKNKMAATIRTFLDKNCQKITEKLNKKTTKDPDMDLKSFEYFK